MNVSEDSIENLKGLKINLQTINEQYRIYIDAFQMKPWLKQTVVPTMELYKELFTNECDDCIDEYGGELVSLVWFFVRNNMPSIIAPAYNFNDMIDNEIAYVQNYTGKDIGENINLYTYVVSMQNCLFFIKTGLDRLVRVLHYYYKGISVNSTFGHQKNENTYTGMLSYANQNKDGDELLNYIIEQYHKWIKECVAFRDGITHYDDLMSCSSSGENGELLGIATLGRGGFLETEIVKGYVENYYEMISWIYEFLLVQDKRFVPCDFYGMKLSADEVKVYLENPEEWISKNARFGKQE